MYTTICLDYGHGGVINGAYQTAGKQYHFEDARGNVELSFYEGVYNRQVASKLIQLLLENGYRVYDVVAGRYITAPTPAEQLEQRDVSLTTRVERANAVRNSIYLSLHGNAIGATSRGPSLNARGFLGYTGPGQTTSDKIAEDIINAVAAQTAFKVRRETVDGDSDYEENFYVLRKTNSPAVLLESGFFTNLEEAKYMASATGQWALANAILAALAKWLNKAV